MVWLPKWPDLCLLVFINAAGTQKKPPASQWQNTAPALTDMGTLPVTTFASSLACTRLSLLTTLPCSFRSNSGFPSTTAGHGAPPLKPPRSLLWPTKPYVRALRTGTPANNDLIANWSVPCLFYPVTSSSTKFLVHITHTTASWPLYLLLPPLDMSFPQTSTQV